MEKILEFLNSSPTVYHAAKEISSALTKAGFIALSEGDKWKLEEGKEYFVAREDTLIAAFRLPKKKAHSAVILASHIDSPGLKIKPRPEIFNHGIGQLATEIYGAPLLHTWLDRDLVLAGRLIAQGKSKLVLFEDRPLTIPSLALHLNREVNEKGLIVHKQDHLKAIFSVKEKHFGLGKYQSFDLFLVPLEKGSFLGIDREMISSYRLDNLSSAFAGLEALLKAKSHSDTIQMAVFWDHEEIGSKTYLGADSFFANQILERICLQFQMDREDHYRLKSRSLCLSCDVGHAFHPNFADKYDPQNAPLLGGGPVIKFSSRYATNGVTAAPIVRLAEKQKIPLQTFASRSDISSGGTVGALMAANLGIPTVDLGIACWAMHSIRETISTQDAASLCQLLKAALEEL